MGIANVVPQFVVEPETVQTNFIERYDIVTAMNYLIGVRTHLIRDYTHNEDLLVRMEADKAARIMHNLCIVRTGLLKGYNKIIQNNGEIYNVHESLTNALTELSVDGIVITNKSARTLPETIAKLNLMISDKINNLQRFFPNWLDWGLVRSLFVVPDGGSANQIINEGYKLRRHRLLYPFSLYIYWREPRDLGNILHNDKKFVEFIYREAGQPLPAELRKNLVTEEVIVTPKLSEWAEEANKIGILVDCENSDTFTLYNAIAGLPADVADKICKIVLCNDRSYTSRGWDTFMKEVPFTTEEIAVDRIKTGKSLVDMTLAVAVTRMHYKDEVDSFILASSDSDFWALINNLDEARFMVMAERNKCGADLKAALTIAKVMFCYIDDFPVREDNRLAEETVMNLMEEALARLAPGNLKSLFDETLKNSRVGLSEEVRCSVYQTIKESLTVEVDEDGNISIVMKE